MSRIQEVGSKVRWAREAAGLTQADLGDALGIGANAVSKIETGRAMLTLEHLEKLPAILGQSLGWFLSIDALGLAQDEETLINLYRALPVTGPHRKSVIAWVAALVKILREMEAEARPLQTD